jgi:hypothetical protein
MRRLLLVFLLCPPLTAATAGPTTTAPTSRPVLGASTRPAEITLHLKAAPARAGLDQFADQAGAPLPLVAADLLEKNPLPPITLDVDRQPFWRAMETFSKATGIEPLANPEDPYPRFTLTLGAGAFWAEPHAVAGPVVVFANDVTRTQTAELGKKRHKIERELSVNLTAFVEPGLRVLAVSTGARLKSAVDERGQSLKPGPDGQAADDDEIDRNPQQGVYTWPITMELGCPADVGRRIARLTGTLNLRVQTAGERVEVDDVLKARGVQRTVAGGAAFTFKNLKQAGEDYHLSFTLLRGKLPPARWQDLHHSAYQGQMILLDAQGRVVCGRAAEQGGDYGANKIEATIRFFKEPTITDPNAGPPAKLVWVAPTRSVVMPVEFELRDLPIPE